MNSSLDSGICHAGKFLCIGTAGRQNYRGSVHHGGTYLFRREMKLSEHRHHLFCAAGDLLNDIVSSIHASQSSRAVHTHPEAQMERQHTSD
jgi:hypothetical protein